jgi:hypothetical protein
MPFSTLSFAEPSLLKVSRLRNMIIHILTIRVRWVEILAHSGEGNVV